MIYLAGALAAVALWGSSGIVKGVKWTATHAKCAATFGVKGCKAKPAVATAVTK